jgi:hypothetical protein
VIIMNDDTRNRRRSAANRSATDGRIERAKDSALGGHHDSPSGADHAGEAAGGIGGALTGAGIGAAAGPVGILIGGVAGAMGGWWAGRAVAEAAERLTLDDDEYYRRHFEERRGTGGDHPGPERRYEELSKAYYLGHIAAHNPNFLRRQFDEIEKELERAWGPFEEADGSWRLVRDFARTGYHRGAGE